MNIENYLCGSNFFIFHFYLLLFFVSLHSINSNCMMKLFKYPTYGDLLKARKRLNETAEANRRKAMQELGTKQSVFADDLPSDIGRIVYVDSLRWDMGAASLWQRLKSMLLVLAIVAIVSVPAALITSAGSKDFGMIFWIVVGTGLVVAVGASLRQWGPVVGTDYFVGEQGCAIVNVKGSRKNVTSKWMYHYRHYNTLLVSETWQDASQETAGANRVLPSKYVLFETGFFNLRFHHDSEKYASAGFDKGTHLRWHEGDIVPEPQFYFWNKVEEQWTKLQLENMGNNLAQMERHTFYEFSPCPDNPRVAVNASLNYYALPRLSIDGKEVMINDRILRRENVTRISRQVGFGFNNLVFKTVDDDTLRVPIAYIGNRMLLIRLLEKWLGQRIEYEK